MKCARVLIAIFCCLPAIAAQDGFGALYPHPANFAGSDIITGLVAADFDNDGNLDLATAVAVYGNKVEIWLGNGDGSHVQRATYPMSSPSFLAAADFNGDGNQDLAIANLQDRSLSIKLGLGDGTFVAGSTIGNLTGQGWRVAVGEFNDDDALDVVMASPSGNLLFSGNGDGTFNVETTVPGASRSVVVGDFNEDGLDDVAEPAQVLLGDGALGFVVGDDLVPSLGNVTSQIATADLDGDDHLDLVVAGAGAVSVFLGDGTGAFTLDETHTSLAVLNVMILDLDVDGTPDLVTSHSGEQGPRGVGVLHGLGAGTFAAAEQIDTGDSSIYSTASGDFDHDGHPDVALADSHNGNSGVILGRGDGTFELPLFYGAPPPATVVSTVDLNLDGRDDLVRSSFSRIKIELATGVSTFGYDEFTLPLFRFANVAELNGDGVPDIVTFSQDGFSFWSGDGDGGFALDVMVPAADTDWRERALDDLNGDQISDVVVESPGGLSVYLGRAESGFESLAPFVLSRNPNVLALGRIDEDAHADLLMAIPGGTLIARMGVGDGTFESAEIETVVGNLCAMAVGDLDGDSLLDLVLTGYADDKVHAWTGDGTGSFFHSDEMTMTAQQEGCNLLLSDLDGDSVLDVVVTMFGNGAVLFPGNGDATFGTGQGFLAVNAAAGDFDLDGRPDLVGWETISLNRGGPDAFTFLPDGVTLVWPSEPGAQSYTVYRGLLAGLVDADEDGLPDGGYGNCISTLDDDDRDPYLIDADLPPAGTGFFYLVGFVDEGGEHGLGATSAGLSRVPQGVCP